MEVNYKGNPYRGRMVKVDTEAIFSFYRTFEKYFKEEEWKDVVWVMTILNTVDEDDEPLKDFWELITEQVDPDKAWEIIERFAEIGYLKLEGNVIDCDREMILAVEDKQ